MKRIRIHPCFDFNWCSYFLQGIIDIYGYDSIEFSTQCFPVEYSEAYSNGGTGLLLAILIKENKKICLDPRDELDINQNVYEWADLYAKTNLPDDYSTSLYEKKLKPLAPFFPIVLDNLTCCVGIALKTFRYNFYHPIAHIKKYFYRSYYWRDRWENYCIDDFKSTNDYVAYAVSYRKKDEVSNLLRSYFMEACLESGIKLDGGFFFRSDISIPKHMDKYFMNTNLAHRHQEYFKRTKLSAMEFICPAVKNNHSWRLGEYLAMGKAIIITDNIKPLSAPLTHGVNAHFVEPKYNSIKEAVELIKSDHTYKNALEAGALEYYKTQVTPRKLLERVLNISEYE